MPYWTLQGRFQHRQTRIVHKSACLEVTAAKRDYICCSDQSPQKTTCLSRQTSKHTVNTVVDESLRNDFRCKDRRLLTCPSNQRLCFRARQQFRHSAGQLPTPASMKRMKCHFYRHHLRVNGKCHALLFLPVVEHPSRNLLQCSIRPVVDGGQEGSLLQRAKTQRN
jgi:hypothetical protein